MYSTPLMTSYIPLNTSITRQSCVIRDNDLTVGIKMIVIYCVFVDIGHTARTIA